MSKWPMVKLGDVCTIARGGSPRPIDAFITNDANGVNWIKIGDASSASIYITKTAEKIKPEGVSKSREVFEGDLILSNSMSFGRPYIMKTSGCIHDGWLLIRDDKNLFDKTYLCYILGAPNSYTQMKKMAVGGVVNNLNSTVIKQLEIPLPPIPEQVRIVEQLDQAQKLIDNRKEQLKLMDDLIQSTFYDLFGDLSAGHVPQNGEKCKLGEQVTLQRGKDITQKSAKNGDVPVISSGGISFYHNEPLISGPGVLLGRKGSVGKVHYTKIDFWPHDTTLYVKEFNGNIPLFVYYFFLNFPISSYEASAANPSLNRNNLHPVEIGWPPLDLQTAFADRVQQIETIKSQMSASLTDLEQNFNALMQQSFGG